MGGKGSDPEGNYYVDERCEELENLLRSSQAHDGFTVKRRRYGDIMRKSDVFIIQDAEEENTFELEAWKVDVLPEAELLLYIDMEMKREYYINLKLVVLFQVIRGIPILLAIVFSTYGLLESSDDSSTLLLFGLTIAIIFIPASVFSEILYQRRRESYDLQQDLKVVRENPSYIRVLQKLATVPESELVYSKEYVKRLEEALSVNQI